MSSYNSMSNFFEHTLNVQNNSLTILSALTDVITSNSESIILNLVSNDNVEYNYSLPTLKYLKNEITRLENNLNIIIGSGAGNSIIETSDGVYKKLVESNLFKEPSEIDTLKTPTTFNIKSNWFFESFLTPLLYVSFDLSDYVDYNVKEIFYKRIIINADSDETKTYYDNTYKNRNDIDYNLFIEDLKSRNISYFSDEGIVKFPIFISRYSGYFDVISYKDIIRETIIAGSPAQETVRKYFLNTLYYTDNLQTYNNTEILQPGDKLEFGQITTYEIEEVNTSENSIIVKMLSGNESISVGTKKLKILTEAFSVKTIQINVGYDEREVIFLKPIDSNTNLTTINFSKGVGFYTNELINNDNVNLKSYYNEKVIDFGKLLIMMAKDNIIPAIYGIKPDAPDLTKSSFKVVIINNHKQNTSSVEDIKSKLSQKNSLYSELNQLQNSIQLIRNKLYSSQFENEQEKKSLSDQLNLLIKNEAATKKLYISLLSELNTILQSPPAEISKPKFRVRGFFPIPAPKISESNIPQQIVQFIISYRYLSKDGTSNNTEQYNFLDENGNVLQGYYSNWNEYLTVPLRKVYDESIGKYVWKNENIENGDVININQIDIPISAGESVEIRVKSISESGYPTNPVISDWSKSVVITFPEEYEYMTDLITELKSVYTENIRSSILQDLENMGLNSHLSNSFNINDKYFVHSSDSISSGFFDNAGNIINLYEKIKTIDTSIKQIQDTISQVPGKLLVYILGPNGEKYNISNNSCVDIFAGYYYDIISGYPPNERKGAIITNKYKLIIENDGLLPLNLVSRFPGGIDEDLMDSDILSLQDEDYAKKRKYDKVPLMLSSVNANKIANDKYFQQMPFQSAQRKSQYIYLRKNDIGLINELYKYDNNSCNVSNNSLYPEILSYGQSYPFIWNFNIGGQNSGGGYLSDFCVHILHPDIQGVTDLYDNINFPPVSSIGPATYPLFTHSKLFNIESFQPDGEKQIGYCRANLQSSEVKDHYPLKMGFYENDRYLIGKNTCGNYLYIAPSIYDDIIVDGTDYLAKRTLESGSSHRIEIPIIYQFRMTDFFGDGYDGIGHIAGISNTQVVKNVSYAKKIGIDLYVKDTSVFSFDIRISSKYKSSTPVKITTPGISSSYNTH